MASTYWKPFQGSLTPGVVCLNATWTITLDATGETTEDEPVLTVADTSGLSVGTYVAGPNIPSLSYIISIDSATEFTISADATADSGGAVTFVFTESVGDLIATPVGLIGAGKQIVFFNAAGGGSENYYNETLACDITMTNDAGFAAAESMAYNVYYDIVNGPTPLGGDQNGFVLRWNSLTSTIDTDATGETTDGDNSVVVADTASPTQLVAGMGVSGVGIVAGSFIKSVDSTTEISLSHDATETDTGVTLTFEAPEVPTDAEFASKTYHCALWLKDSSV